MTYVSQTTSPTAESFSNARTAVSFLSIAVTGGSLLTRCGKGSIGRTILERGEMLAKESGSSEDT